MKLFERINLAMEENIASNKEDFDLEGEVSKVESAVEVADSIIDADEVTESKIEIHDEIDSLRDGSAAVDKLEEIRQSIQTLLEENKDTPENITNAQVIASEEQFSYICAKLGMGMKDIQKYKISPESYDMFTPYERLKISEESIGSAIIDVKDMIVNSIGGLFTKISNFFGALFKTSKSLDRAIAALTKDINSVNLNAISGISLTDTDSDVVSLVKKLNKVNYFNTGIKSCDNVNGVKNLIATVGELYKSDMYNRVDRTTIDVMTTLKDSIVNATEDDKYRVVEDLIKLSANAFKPNEKENAVLDYMVEANPELKSIKDQLLPIGINGKVSTYAKVKVGFSKGRYTENKQLVKAGVVGTAMVVPLEIKGTNAGTRGLVADIAFDLANTKDRYIYSIEKSKSRNEPSKVINGTLGELKSLIDVLADICDYTRDFDNKAWTSYRGMFTECENIYKEITGKAFLNRLDSLGYNKGEISTIKSIGEKHMIESTRFVIEYNHAVYHNKVQAIRLLKAYKKLARAKGTNLPTSGDAISDIE